MKRILVPTDFNPVADNALGYAIEMASDFDSDIYLYHVYSFDKITYDIAFPKDEQPYAKELERQMSRTEEKFFEKAKNKKVRIRTFVEEDSFFSLFKQKVNEREIDMIVMGSKGASGIKDFIYGSVAATALEMAEVPVLIIPPGFTFYPFQKIILSIDQKQLTSRVLSPLREFALNYGAGVTLLNVKTGSEKQANIAYDLPLEGVETSFREVSVSKSISDGINRFVQKEGCDILCMVRREKNLFDRVFKKSITRVQVFSNQVPLLVLPEV